MPARDDPAPRPNGASWRLGLGFLLTLGVLWPAIGLFYLGNMMPFETWDQAAIDFNNGFHAEATLITLAFIVWAGVSTVLAVAASCRRERAAGRLVVVVSIGVLLAVAGPTPPWAYAPFGDGGWSAYGHRTDFVGTAALPLVAWSWFVWLRAMAVADLTQGGPTKPSPNASANAS